MSTLKNQMKAAENEWLAGWKSGPIRTRWTELPLQVDDPAPNFELYDLKALHVHSLKKFQVS